MTPDVAVARLAELISARSEFTEEELYTAMANAGIPLQVADRAYKFTQIAWGRVFLEGMGIKFAPNYFCFDGDGEVLESGLLSEQPYYIAAMDLAKRHPPVWTPNFAVMSSDVGAVNSALKDGSKPENLVTAPPGLFMENPTAAGIDRARQVMTESLSTIRKKPWWQFW